MNRSRLNLLLTLIAVLILSACGGRATPMPPTPDLSQNLRPEPTLPSIPDLTSAPTQAADPVLTQPTGELPLTEALIPFLMARSGRALDEFALWVKSRRPPPWLLRMVEFLAMSTAVHEELLRYVMTKTDDPDIRARQRLMAKVVVDTRNAIKARHPHVLKIGAPFRAEPAAATARV